MYMGWLKRWPPVKVALAVNARYGADGGGQLAAALTYYGFLSLFPLILLGLASIGFFLAGEPRLQAEWSARVSEAVPGLGPLIGDNLETLIERRAHAGAIGVVGLLLSGTALTNSAGYALSRVFRRPRVAGFVKQKLWAIGATLGLGAVALAGVGVSGAVAGLRGRGVVGLGLGASAFAISYALDVLLFMAAYRMLSAGRGPPVRTVWPGAVVAAGGWTVLKVGGAWYGARTVAGASEVYGTFGGFVGILALLYLASRLFLYGAEMNAYLFERKAERQGGEEVPNHASAARSDGRVPADQSTGELVTSIASDVATLVRKEMELARQEIVEAVTARLKAAVALGAAGVLGLFVLAFGALAAADSLAQVMPTWGARLVVAGAFLLLTLVAVAFGAARLRRPPIAPVETKRTIKEDVEWAKAQLKR